VGGSFGIVFYPTFGLLNVVAQINSGTSPYEGEDDFFSRANDDLSLGAKRSLQLGDFSGRTRGQSESVVSR